jgi:hypothetical protein
MKKGTLGKMLIPDRLETMKMGASLAKKVSKALQRDCPSPDERKKNFLG